MPSRSLLLLLVIFMAQHQDMGVSSPIHGTHSRKCHWNEFKHLTHNFYHQALKIYTTTNSTDDNVIQDLIPRIQCHHYCVPEHLILNPRTCLERIFQILSYYKSVLLPLTNDQNTEFAKVVETISDILSLLQACDYKDHNLIQPADVPAFFVKGKIGSPLLSISIYVARIFSPGNPANHIIHPEH